MVTISDMSSGGCVWWTIKGKKQTWETLFDPHEPATREKKFEIFLKKCFDRDEPHVDQYHQGHFYQFCVTSGGLPIQATYLYKAQI